jgi:hypothetical protein
MGDGPQLVLLVPVQIRQGDRRNVLGNDDFRLMTHVGLDSLGLPA